MKRRTNQKPVESVRDFRARIAGIMRGSEPNDEIIPVRHVPSILVRPAGCLTPSETEAWRR